MTATFALLDAVERPEDVTLANIGDLHSMAGRQQEARRGERGHWSTSAKVSDEAGKRSN